MSFHATEQMDLDSAKKRLPHTAAWMQAVMDRVQSVVDVPQGAKVLEIGAAQGRGLVSLQQQGYQAVGVEPWDEARTVAGALANDLGVSLDIRAGAAESLPCEDEQFDVVVALSVMEHVDDLDASLSEIYRVLKPGGVFWFNSASSMCPRQREIRSFPFFGWYPDPVKKRIMAWARDHKPELVGHTEKPAFHWWTDRIAHQRLTNKGFRQVWNRWDLRQPGEDGGVKAQSVQLVRQSKVLQRIADTAVVGCSYAALK